MEKSIAIAQGKIGNEAQTSINDVLNTMESLQRTLHDEDYSKFILSSIKLHSHVLFISKHHKKISKDYIYLIRQLDQVILRTIGKRISGQKISYQSLIEEKLIHHLDDLITIIRSTDTVTIYNDSRHDLKKKGLTLNFAFHFAILIVSLSFFIPAVLKNWRYYTLENTYSDPIEFVFSEDVNFTVNIIYSNQITTSGEFLVWVNCTDEKARKQDLKLTIISANQNDYFIQIHEEVLAFDLTNKKSDNKAILPFRIFLTQNFPKQIHCKLKVFFNEKKFERNLPIRIYIAEKPILYSILGIFTFIVAILEGLAAVKELRK